MQEVSPTVIVQDRDRPVNLTIKRIKYRFHAGSSAKANNYNQIGGMMPQLEPIYSEPLFPL